MTPRNRSTVLGLTIPFFMAVAVQRAESHLIRDFEGERYKTVQIGSQLWMAENFKSEFTPEGRPLKGVAAYEKDERHVPVYGRLYTHEAAVQACPRGWRLPTPLDLETLFMTLPSLSDESANGMRHVAGSLLKSTGTLSWRPSSTPGLDSAGFSAMPGGRGLRDEHGIYFDGLGETASFWSDARSQNGQSAWWLGCRYNSAGIHTGFAETASMFSVRYLLDQPPEH